ncbi:MAG: MFS transporter [Polyangiaceae bacterium]
MTRDFTLYQAARFLLTVSIQMQSVVVGYQVCELTKQPLDLGFVGLAQFLPVFLLSPVTGNVADRFDRRRILLVCEAGFALCSSLLLALQLAHNEDVRAIYAVLVLFGILRAFSGPASQALTPHLVPSERLSRALAIASTVWQGATIAGPAIGGVIYAAGGAAAVYASSLISVLMALSFITAMKVRTGAMAKTAVTFETLFAGLKYVRQNPLLLGAISLDLFAVLLGGAVALLPIYARDILHVGSWGMGLMRSAPAAGASLMALMLSVRPVGGRAGLKMLGSVLLFGLATIVFGLSTSFPVSLAALFVLGAADMVSVVVRQTLLQIETPDDMRGRVSAVNLVFVGASNELGEFESGLTAAWLGAVPAVVAGGVGTCLVVLGCAVLFPKLRDVDTLESKSS